MKTLFWRFFWLLCSFIEKVYYKARIINIKNNLASCGNNVYFGSRCLVSATKVHVGNDVYIGDGAVFASSLAEIYIGNKVMFGPNVEIHTGNHRIDIKGMYMFDVGLDQKRPQDDEDVIIEDDVWIGARAIILKGVHIHKGSIIGAGTIITRDVPPYSIVIGAKPYSVRTRFNEAEIFEHEAALKKMKESEV